MFEQHPVPQQISSYQFRLVGDMTLKQFFQLAGGAAVGLLLYASPLPSIFKWPLIIFSVVMGAAFAFLPLQERPLSEWIAAFFRAVYGPTLYTWKKVTPKDIYFLPNEGTLPQPSVSNTPSKSSDASTAKLDALENKFLSSVGGLFGLGGKSTVAVAKTEQSSTIINPTNPTLTESAKIVSQIVTHPKTEIQEGPKAATPGNIFVTTPNLPRVKVDTQVKGFSETISSTSNQIKTTQVTPSIPQGTVVHGASPAQVSVDAAPPTQPTIPNILVGQVLTHDLKIVDSAIMEIKDFQGRPVRALKTNRLGHFMIVTPLPSGSYTISIEKEGLIFDPISVEVHGAIVQPILIKSKEEIKN